MNSPNESISSALVVDDNTFNREVFSLALESLDYKTIEASNGLEALAILDHSTFDLMVLDLRMPVMDGGVVLKKLRTDPRHDAMIVVIATANPHMAADIEALSDYIVYKPVEMPEFAALIGRLKKAPKTAPTG
jgi:CheY-like chemotaxis protein